MHVIFFVPLLSNSGHFSVEEKKVCTGFSYLWTQTWTFYGWKPERNGADKRLGCDSGVWKDASVWRHAFGTATPQERYGRIKESNHLEMHDSPEQLRKALNWHSCQFPSPLMFLTSVKIYNNKIIQRKLIKIQCYFKVTCSIYCNNFKLNTINNETFLFSKCGYISDKFSLEEDHRAELCEEDKKRVMCRKSHDWYFYTAHFYSFMWIKGHGALLQYYIIIDHIRLKNDI